MTSTLMRCAETATTARGIATLKVQRRHRTSTSSRPQRCRSSASVARVERREEVRLAVLKEEFAKKKVFAANSVEEFGTRAVASGRAGARFGK